MGYSLKLKDGTYTQDRRLARIVQFDERSRQYDIRAALKAAPVVKMESKTWSVPLHLDQGNSSICVGASFSHELMAEPVATKKLDLKFATEKIYYEAQKIDEWSGGEYPGAEPSYGGTSVLAGVKVCKKLGYIKEYRWAFTLEDLALAVSTLGPAVLGLNFYRRMMNTNSEGFIIPTGGFVGGHAILCKGVNFEEQYFVLHNSWGDDWGQGGDCKISFEALRGLLAERGEACIPTVRSALSTEEAEKAAKNWWGRIQNFFRAVW